MYNCDNCYQMSGFMPRNNLDTRGPLLPFLAGVLVTTPFLFLNKQNNYQPYPYQVPYYQPYMNYPSPYYNQPLYPYYR